MRPLVSHVVVRPFVEAYRIVADVLAHDDVTSRFRGGPARRSGSGGSTWPSGGCAAPSRSRCCCSRRRCSWPGTEGCSSGDDLAARRAAFLAELRDLVRRLDRIEDLAIRRYIRDAVGAMPAD